MRRLAPRLGMGAIVGVVATVVALVVAVVAAPSPGARSAAAPPVARQVAADRPNIVVILTDDQTAESARVMGTVQTELVAQGTSFTRAAVTMPLCCPSRASLITGQYPHNNGVRDNVLPDGGYAKIREADTLPVWLRAAGYRTAHVGRTLNQYTAEAAPLVPDGWDEWYGLVEDASLSFLYRDFVLASNGRLLHYGPDAYLTDVLGDIAVQLVDRLAGDEPFYLELAPAAPHTGRVAPGEPPIRPIVPERHEDAFADEPLPDTPALFEEDLSDKPAWVQEAGGDRGQARRDAAVGQYRAQLRSLLSVDESVAALLDALDAAGELDDTIVVFTSDNGYLNGEHGLVDRKISPYTETVRVPLIVRGPGFEAGAEVDRAVSNADLVPLFLERAGATPSVAVDGHTLSDPLADRAVLVEGPSARGGQPGFVQAATARWSLIRSEDGELELYDHETDPFELDDVSDDPAVASVRDRLVEALDALVACAGPDCVVTLPGIDG
jgi:N-acetylglucosamine-6-sulfatase